MITLALIIVAVQAGAVAAEWRARQDLAARCDLNADGIVDSADQGMLLGAWTPRGMGANHPADLTGDATVNGADLGVLQGFWAWARHDSGDARYWPTEGAPTPSPFFSPGERWRVHWAYIGTQQTAWIDRRTP